MGVTSFSCRGILLISSLFQLSNTGEVPTGEVPLQHSLSILQRLASTLERSKAVPGNGRVPTIVRTALSIVKSLPESSSVVFADHDNHELQVLVKVLSGALMFQGTAFFNPKMELDSNTTSIEELVDLARQVRVGRREVKVILLSDDPNFVSAFGRFSLERRLLAGHSRLLVVGRLSQQEVSALTRHWTFSMMNTHFVLPSTKGESQSMYGETVNVSALPYEPYWMEEKTEDGSVKYSGADRLMLEAMASTLNFSINSLPVKSWEEVQQSVAERLAWVAPIIHLLAPAWLKHLDFTRTYEHDVNLAFAMVKPVIEPKWQSLYYPLSSEVWLLTLGTLLVVSLSLSGVIKGRQSYLKCKHITTGGIVMWVFGTLLTQGSDNKISAAVSAVSSRTLVISWLSSAFIIGTIYKGNLIASILAPRYPPRPETLEELVKVAEKATMPSFGDVICGMLEESDVYSRRALGNILELGYEAKEGLELTQKYRYPYLDSLRYLQHQLALHYTEADGTSKFYVGRERLLTTLNGWPIPHDAPYKDVFDFVISALDEVLQTQPFMGVVR
ncbi:uncharacterized protein [Macrobrachium rosenbergii]|uniref:uncharacterized protein n=1 Tax=Macrobrachium rosenbergii TaxID=79674 RepID=UPI0034D59EAE